MSTLAAEYRKPVPRDYQATGKNNFLSGDGNLLIQLATGMGKTNLSAMIAGEYPGERVLFLAHTRTLVFQTCQTYMRFGMWPNVEMADEYTGGPYLPDARDKKKIFRDKFPPNEWFQFDRVLVSTIQSFSGRVDKYREGGFDLLVHDECHRFGGVFLRTLDRLKQFNPHMRVCGLSATPYDGKKMAKVYSGFALRVPVAKAIDDGYLVGVECERAVLDGVDESMWKVGPSKGGGRDITDDSLARSMDNRVCIESIAHEVVERAGDKKGILFLPGVAVTESVCEALNALKPGCAVFVHGGVKPKRENRRRIRMIEDGTAQFICGCDQLIEGFDVPDIAVVVMARFTAQRGRYEQMLGRGLRVLADCIEGVHTPEGRRAAIAASKKPNCLAEGTRILTDHGLVPIELVTTNMKVWDGVEFVSHNGPIFKGVKPVVTYAGITATEDHRVWTKEGWKPLAWCASTQTPICVTGAGRTPVWETEGRVRGGDLQGQREQGTPFSGMRRVRTDGAEGSTESPWWDCRVSEVWEPANSSRLVVQAVSKRTEPMHQREVQFLGAVRRQGYPIQVPISYGDGGVGAGESGSRPVEGTGPDRQRWTLRAGESSIRHTITKHIQHQEATPKRGDARIQDETPGGEVLRRHAEITDPQWSDMGADRGQILQPQVEQEERRVWDLLNAGPRHRFTAEGLLVANCTVIDFANNSRIRLMTAEDVLLDAGDDAKRAKALGEFVQKTRDANDKRALREQLRDQESLFALEEALREKGGPPPKADFMYEQVNLFGVGGTAQKDAKRVNDDARRPTTQLIADAYDVMIDPARAEAMSHGQLAAEVARRREVRVGRKGFGFLVGGCKLDKGVIADMCLNWHDVQYLRKLVRARPGGDLPANWRQLVTDNRRKRNIGGQA